MSHTYLAHHELESKFIIIFAITIIIIIIIIVTCQMWLAGTGARPAAPPAASAVPRPAPSTTLPASGLGPVTTASPSRLDPTEEQLRASTQTQELATRFRCALIHDLGCTDLADLQLSHMAVMSCLLLLAVKA